ncbi:MAG: urease accessory protein UreF [Alistipes sp.]|nr:urease accessory protein UreF [Alistipes sp.]
MNCDATTLMRLMEFTDSAFPVGTFSFSNGLETAAEEGLVRDAETLERYTRDIARQAAFTDGIAALHAFRSRLAEDYEGILEADRQALLCKLNGETRLMTRRMGRKLAELSKRIFPDPFVDRWLDDLTAQTVPGTYPVAQGMLFAACGISERALFCAGHYGAVNLVLSAALRCVRVSHFDTQRILFRLSDEAEALYAEVRQSEFADMHAFAPQIDILASLHEKGSKRLFMN